MFKHIQVFKQLEKKSLVKNKQFFNLVAEQATKDMLHVQ